MKINRLPSISSALEFRREAYAWTQTKMAKSLGLQKSHYSEIINGQRNLPYRAACAAYVLGVPYTVLLSPKNQRPTRAKP